MRSGVIVFALLLMLVTTQCLAEIHGEVVEYGYYQALEEIKRKENSSTPTGYVRKGGDVELIAKTAEIPILPNQLFGFKFRIMGFDKELYAATLDLVVTHPEMTRPNGSKTTGYTYPVRVDVVDGVIENQSGYKFDKDYEMVDGEWLFQYWYKGKMIVEQKFQLYRPKSDQTTMSPENASSIVNINAKRENTNTVETAVENK